jgi:rSAM/selenodomain-associated transferase 1
VGPESGFPCAACGPPIRPEGQDSGSQPRRPTARLGLKPQAVEYPPLQGGLSPLIVLREGGAAFPIQSRPVSARRLLLFTKPAREGRVKTRLIGDLTPAEAAALHAAFLDDLLDRLREGVREGGFELRLAWALDPGEEVPVGPLPGARQEGGDLGERLYRALSGAAREAGAVMALGSDHPTLPLELVHRAFERVEAGGDVVLGPAEDGGYYLIALRAGAVAPRLFEEIAWSTSQVLAATLDRCRELGLAVELLPQASDVDTPEDLRRLGRRMAEEGDLGCPRTQALLASLGFLQSRIQNPKSKIEEVLP